jgi:hypothetical protein
VKVAALSHKTFFERKNKHLKKIIKRPLTIWKGFWQSFNVFASTHSANFLGRISRSVIDSLRLDVEKHLLVF